jgi:DNA-binding response OmpR family regulator
MSHSSAETGVPNTTRKTILLADDDAAIRTMVGRVLAAESYNVFFAKTGCEAARQFKTDPPDLVLLDLNMPEKDGWETFEEMCAVNPMLPVIIITASPYDYEQAVQLGADALMEKPLNLSLLLKTIRELLAESPSACMARLTNPNFRTSYLKLTQAGGNKDSNR